MPVIDRSVAQITIAATAAPTPAPGGGTQGIQIGESVVVRTFLTYTGTVTGATLKIWFRDRATGVWYEGASTDDLDPLTPGGAAPINEVRDWQVGGAQEVYFQLTAVTGGGTVEVRALGVQK
jgi:hypothetical protein